VGHRLTLRGLAPPEGHLHGVGHELAADVVGDGPAHNPAAKGVEHDGEEDPALGGGVLGDVHDPEPVRALGIEGSVDEVVTGLGRRVPAGAAPTPATVDAGHAGLAHQALDPLAGAAGGEAEAELGVHPRGPIGASAHPVDVDDGVGQGGVGPVAIAAGLGPPRVEPGGRHLHHPTAGRHR
jgi:hypothetical protein